MVGKKEQEREEWEGGKEEGKMEGEREGGGEEGRKEGKERREGGRREGGREEGEGGRKGGRERGRDEWMVVWKYEWMYDWVIEKMNKLKGGSINKVNVWVFFPHNKLIGHKMGLSVQISCETKILIRANWKLQNINHFFPPQKKRSKAR